MNATGPWVKQFFDDGLKLKSPYGIRLIKGSHIVVPRVHTQKQAYILQNEDNRIVFVIPWMDEFSIIGTTDVEYKGDPKNVEIDENEINYLLKVYNAHFKKQLSRDDIVWTYSGVRPLCDDESDSPQAITRDYTLDVHDENGQAPLLSVFGGKLTTYRKLAEHALEKLAQYYPDCGPAWTKNAVLPGGDIGGTRDDYAANLRRRYPFISEGMARHFARTYGSHTEVLLEGAKSREDLGENFGHEFYEAELRYLVKHEWVRELDDAIWRRTKAGYVAERSRTGAHPRLAGGKRPETGAVAGFLIGLSIVLNPATARGFYFFSFCVGERLFTQGTAPDQFSPLRLLTK